MSFHLMLGAVLLVAGLLTLVEVLGDLGQTPLRFSAPVAVGALAALLQLFVLLRLGPPESRGGTIDWLHFGMCAALATGALVTGLGRRSTSRLLTEAAAPLSVLVTGTLFITHPSTGISELLLHLGIGALLGLSAAAHLAALLAAEGTRGLRIFGALLLLYTGLVLAIHDLHEDAPGEPHKFSSGS